MATKGSAEGDKTRPDEETVIGNVDSVPNERKTLGEAETATEKKEQAAAEEESKEAAMEEESESREEKMKEKVTTSEAERFAVTTEEPVKECQPQGVSNNSLNIYMYSHKVYRKKLICVTTSLIFLFDRNST